MKIRTNTERGSFRVILLLLIAMGGCLWMGGQGVYTALLNRKPTTLGCSDLAKGQPSAHWLILTNCQLQIGSSAYLIHRSKDDAASAGHITEAYVPIQTPGNRADDRCYAVMATKDPHIISLLEEMRQARTESAAAQFLDRHGKDLLITRNVEGLVRFGVEERNGEHAKLAGLRGNLASSYIILAEGESPNLTLSAGLLTLGLFIAAGLVFMFRAKRETLTEVGKDTDAAGVDRGRS